ncbi:MAG: type II toxin-antitoxin system HipA family toxin, partial [Actinomycetales bacterium]
GWPLGPELPLTSQSVVSGLPGPLADSAPDRWGRGLIDRRIRTEAFAAGRTPRTVTDIDYLLGLSDFTRQGALRYRLGDADQVLTDGSTVPKLIDLPRLLNAADRIGSADDLAAVKTLLDAGSASLGGARPKASVRDGDRLLLAKFPHRSDQWDVMAWEATALDLAARCGIDVPVHELVRIDGRSVLLLDRFDRSGVDRIPFASGMTLLGKRDGDNADYIEVAEALSEHGADVIADLERMWRRIAFSVAIHNTDDHLRNLGFLRGRGGWTLSPMFDVNPDPDPGSRRVTSIGWRNQPEAESRALIDIAPYFDLSPNLADCILDEVRSVVSHWRAVATANGIPRSRRTPFSQVLDRALAAG